MKKDKKQPVACQKCQWYCVKKGYNDGYFTGVARYNIDIDACVHPKLDYLGINNVSGNPEFKVNKCSDRNYDGKCKYFQPVINFFKALFYICVGKRNIDIYNDYQKRQK